MIRIRCTALRGVLVAFAATLAGGVGFAAPASADVTVTPDQAAQGGAAAFQFRITNTSRTASITKVAVALPKDQPIAEVYPLSVPNWGPKLTYQQLDQRISGIHGTTNQVVTQIEWFAVPGKELKPGKSDIVQMEMGPLPATTQLILPVTETYSDGTVVHWTDQPSTGTAKPQHPALVLNLVPAPAQTDTTGEDATDAEDEAADTSGTDGTTLALLISGVVIGLLAGVLLGGYGLVRFRRHRPALDGLNEPEAASDPSGDGDAAASEATAATDAEPVDESAYARPGTEKADATSN